jgi:hypothetical protein
MADNDPTLATLLAAIQTAHDECSRLMLKPTHAEQLAAVASERDRYQVVLNAVKEALGSF